MNAAFSDYSIGDRIINDFDMIFFDQINDVDVFVRVWFEYFSRSI
jgi:hypothetical protein